MLLKSALAAAVLALSACGYQDDHVASPGPNSADALAGEQGTQAAPDCGAPIPLDAETRGPLSTDIEVDPLPMPAAPRCPQAGVLTPVP